MTPRNAIARARTKQHPSRKYVARHRRRFRARGRLAQRTHRTRDRRARRRRVGRGNDDGVGAADQLVSVRSARARSTLPLLAPMARDNPRLAATRWHVAARFGARSSRETASIFSHAFLETKWCVHASLLSLSNSRLEFSSGFCYGLGMGGGLEATGFVGDCCIGCNSPSARPYKIKRLTKLGAFNSSR